MNDRRSLLLIGLAGLVAVAIAFVVAITIVSNPDDSAARTADVPSSAAPATQTPEPTSAPAGDASVPTATAVPTSTPTPTPTPTATPTPDPVPSLPADSDAAANDWQLIFADDFDRLDTSVWETGWFSSTGFSPSVNEDGDACNHPDQLSAVDGVMTFSISETNDDNCILKDGRRGNYVGGLMNTRETFTFSYGYAEARMFLPSDGDRLQNWPAFWHTGFDHPLTGEIDIAEGLSGGVLCSVYHHQGSDGDAVQERGCVDWDDPGGWHVFAAHWQPDRITFYYDGVEVFSTTEGVVGSPHYLVINYTLRADGSAVVPSEMLVDYARVWQIDPDG